MEQQPNGKFTNTVMPKTLTLVAVKAYAIALLTALKGEEALKAKAEKRKEYKGMHARYSGFNTAFERDLGFSPMGLFQPEWKAKGIVAGPLAVEFHTHATKGGIKIYLPDDGPVAGDSTAALSASMAARQALIAAGVQIKFAS
jgi:hypothetical protein